MSNGTLLWEGGQLSSFSETFGVKSQMLVEPTGFVSHYMSQWLSCDIGFWIVGKNKGGQFRSVGVPLGYHGKRAFTVFILLIPILL